MQPNTSHQDAAPVAAPAVIGVLPPLVQMLQAPQGIQAIQAIESNESVSICGFDRRFENRATHVGVHTVAFDHMTAITVSLSCQRGINQIVRDTNKGYLPLYPPGHQRHKITVGIQQAFGVTTGNISMETLDKLSLSPFISDDELLLLADNALADVYRAAITDKNASFRTKVGQLRVRSTEELTFLQKRRFSPRCMSILPAMSAAIASTVSPKVYEREEAIFRVYDFIDQIPSRDTRRAMGQGPNIVSMKLADIRNIICNTPLKLCEIPEKTFTQLNETIGMIAAVHDDADDFGLVRMLNTCDLKRKGINCICQCDHSAQLFRYTYGIGPAHRMYHAAMPMKVILGMRAHIIAYMYIWLKRHNLRDRGVAKYICDFAVADYEMGKSFTKYLITAYM